MSNAASRFRKLPPPRREPQVRASERGTPGDLFDHFGVASDSTRGLPGAVVAAQPCPACGWLCRLDELECPLCGGPSSRSTQQG